MASIRLKIGIRFITMCLLLFGTYADRNSQRKEELIQDTVRKFLGVKSDERTAVPGKIQSLPPQYMMDLYEKYRSGQTPMQGNTVRSILAMRGKVQNIDMLVFNLTGLKTTEQILQSKLYLLKRRKPKGGKKREHSTFRLNVGCLPDMASKHQIDISLSRQKPEWHSYDISESVVTCRQIRKGNDSLLGLTLEIRRPKGSFRSVAFKRLVKPTSQPFVLIFSEDSQNQTTSISSSKKHDDFGEIGDLLRAKARAEGLLPEAYRLPKITGKNRRHRGRRSIDIKNDSFRKDLESKKDFSASDFTLNSYKYSQKHFKTTVENYDASKSSRSDFIKLLRAFIDNIRYSFNVHRRLYHVHKTEFPTNKEVNEVKDFSNNSVQTDKHQPNLIGNHTFQKVLLSELVQSVQQNGDSQIRLETLAQQKRSKRTISDTLLYSTEERGSNSSDPSVSSIEVISEDTIQTSGIIPKSRRRNRMKKVHHQPRRQKKKRRRNRNRKLPFWWTKHESKFHTQDMKQLCRRKSLVVDFSQLGWDDWIISPKSFNAHYCEGSCTFPIIKHTETSNHAAVQSLIHAMGINTNIPTPSCVPSVTSSLTLLYFDEHGSLVLKSYPNMIVEKCGCR